MILFDFSVIIKDEYSDTETEQYSDFGSDEVDVIEPQESGGKGRRNIKDIIDDHQVALDTKRAVDEENKRLERLQKQKELVIATH